MRGAIRVTFEAGEGKQKLQLVRFITFEEMYALALGDMAARALERPLMSFWDDVLLMGLAEKDHG